MMLLLKPDPYRRYFSYGSSARCEDLNLQDTKAYGGANHLSAGIQHGSWSIHTKPGKPPKDSFVTSSQTANIRQDLKYSKEDIAAVEEWVKRHVETTWHSKPSHPTLAISPYHPPIPQFNSIQFNSKSPT